MGAADRPCAGAGGSAAFWMALLASAAGAACTVAPYEPCPVELEAPLPVDAFAVCQRVLVARYGPLLTADPQAFLLQTGWARVTDFDGERRASVFLDQGNPAVVVESRWLTEPLFGLPHWSAVRGDLAAERELAELLRTELRSAGSVQKP